MQSAIAKKKKRKHTLVLEQGTHRPRTQSPEKVNLDNSKSNNNQSNNIQRLKLRQDCTLSFFTTCVDRQA